jgi:hypothetical protein
MLACDALKKTDVGKMNRSDSLNALIHLLNMI